MQSNKPQSKTRKILLVVAGVVSVTLATIGIVVPLLPTTPLLLLAAACFIRSSDRLYEWLINHRLFGSYIRNYREGRGMPRRQKAMTLVALWLTILVTVVVALEVWLWRLVLVAIAASVTVHIARLKTPPREAGGAPERTSPSKPRRSRGDAL